jgi:hypothetical protein
MSAVVSDVIPVRTRTKQKSLFASFNIKAKVDAWKFSKVWADRNIDNGDLIIDSLEIEPIVLDQFMFIEESKQLVDKLERIGFEKLDTYPNVKSFDNTFYVMYNKKYNVAISLYDSKMKKIVQLAEEIAKETGFGYDFNLEVFLSAIKVLNK